MRLKKMKSIQPVVVALCLFWSAHGVTAQNSFDRPPRLPESRFKSGSATLRAFAPVAERVRNSVVEFVLDGKTVALGAVVEADGLVITKASELKDGKLRCRLA